MPVRKSVRASVSACSLALCSSFDNEWERRTKWFVIFSARKAAITKSTTAIAIIRSGILSWSAKSSVVGNTNAKMESMTTFTLTE